MSTPEFKNGDRVRYLDNNYPLGRGREGTVIGVDKNIIDVTWDNLTKGRSYGPKRSVNKGSVELVEKKSEPYTFKVGDIVRIVAKSSTNWRQAMDETIGSFGKIIEYQGKVLGKDTYLVDLGEHLSWNYQSASLQLISDGCDDNKQPKPYTFKVGDCGKLRGGGEYEILSVDKRTRTYPIRAKYTAPGYTTRPSEGIFSATGQYYESVVSPRDLMPPTHCTTTEHEFTKTDIETTTIQAFQQLSAAAMSAVTTTPQELNMQLLAPVKIEDVTFVTVPSLGTVKAKDLSVDQALSAIKQAEDHIEELKKLKHQPKVIKERINELQDGIKKLVALLDAKHDEAAAKPAK